MGESIVRRFQSCTDSIDSKRARKRPSYCKIDIFFRRPSRTKTMLVSAIAVKSRSSRASASNGFCVIRRQRKRSRWCAIILSVSFRRIGKRFTRNGSRTFRTGALAARSGGDIASRLGIGTAKCACRSNRPVKVGSRIPTRSIPGSRRGSGPTKRWTKKREKNFIRHPCS